MSTEPSQRNSDEAARLRDEVVAKNSPQNMKPDRSSANRPSATKRVHRDAPGPFREVATSAESPGGNDSPSSEKTAPGPALARAALEAARASGRARRTSDRARSRDDGPRRSGYSAAGPDPRDPQRLGNLINGMLAERGWQAPVAHGTVFGAWDRLVGADIAEHCRPTSLRDGELTVQAESTAWATQLRLFTKSLLVKISAAVGTGVVTKIHVHGPSAPSWRKGPLSVRGRGPRDTYG